MVSAARVDPQCDPIPHSPSRVTRRITHSRCTLAFAFAFADGRGDANVQRSTRTGNAGWGTRDARREISAAQSFGARSRRASQTVTTLINFFGLLISK